MDWLRKFNVQKRINPLTNAVQYDTILVMGTIDKLQREARSSARLRGHSLKQFNHYSDTRRFSHCRHCDMQVEVNSKPLPNEIDIGGEAVALNCMRIN